MLTLASEKMYAQLATVAVAGLVGAACAEAIEVVSPSKGEMIQGSSTYTVEWTGTGANERFEIDLYYCGSTCTEGDCGDWVTALCPYGDVGCPDSEGDYDVEMPEPMEGKSGSGYKIRVQDINDESESDCSDEFELLESEEADEMIGDGAYLVVTSPEEGDLALAGGEYTVEFDYDNGLGSSSSRFSIDLYRASGSGDCGTYVTSICDKPSIGCKDSKGDYDVVIPSDTASGFYSIRVGNFFDDVFGCSGIFEVYNDDSPMTDSVDGSFSFYYFM